MNRLHRPSALLAAALCFALSCGPVEQEPLTEASFELTVEDQLKTLRALQAKEHASSRALQLKLDARLQVFLDQAVKKNVVTTIARKNPSDPRLTPLKTAIANDQKLIDDAKGAIVSLVDAQLVAMKQLTAELQKQRGAALPNATATNVAGAFPLHVAVADYTWSLSRRIPTLHTEVPVLHDDPRCYGDLIIDGTLDRYLRAVLDESTEGAARAIRDFQQQLSCLSLRQINTLELALVEQVDPSLKHLLGTASAPVFRAKFRELVAAPILLIADQTRAHSKAKPGIHWLEKYRSELVNAAKTKGSLLHRAGLYVLDPRRSELIFVSSKAQRATPAQPSAARTALLAARDATGAWTTNLLPAFLNAFSQPCYGADLTLDGTGAAGEGLRCDVGCGDAKKDAAQLGRGFTRAVESSQLASGSCPTGTGGGGGGSSSGSSGSGAPGAGGITIGAGAGRSACLLAAVSDAHSDTTGKIKACLDDLHPASGSPGDPSPGVSGGQSCGANVAQEGVDPETFDSGWDDDGERKIKICNSPTDCTTYIERQEEDGSVTTMDEERNVIGNVPHGEASPVDNRNTGGGSGSTGGATGGGSGSTGGATGGGSGSTGGATGGGSGSTGATGGSTGTTGGGAGGGGGDDGQCTEWCESDELDAQGNPDNDNGDEQCGVDAQCREQAVGQCSPEEGSCSGGCTGNDLGTQFVECTSALPGRKTSQPIGHLDPRVIYPAPDTTEPSGLGGLLSCAAGGLPDANSCPQQSIALCSSDKPNCACNKAAPVSSVSGLNNLCTAVQCASASSAQGEAVMAGPMGLSGCGCTSVMTP